MLVIKRILKRLLSIPEAKFLYSNMARIQGTHYTNLEDIYELANNSLFELRRYLDD